MASRIHFSKAILQPHWENTHSHRHAHTSPLLRHFLPLLTPPVNTTYHLGSILALINYVSVKTSCLPLRQSICTYWSHMCALACMCVRACVCSFHGEDVNHYFLPVRKPSCCTDSHPSHRDSAHLMSRSPIALSVSVCV